MTETYDVIIIGGGPAGMAAAIGAAEGGLKKILIIERHGESGGILNQCIHNGFGLHRFGENLTGPEYALNYLNILPSYVEVKLNTMVLSINGQHEVCCLSSGEGLQTLYSKSIILAMGCRERSRGAVNIPGTRPAGVFTAGTAQMYVNIYGLSVGRRVVIRGTGDIGLIMARRLTLEGAEVLACIGAGDHAEGLQRNVAQCLDDFNIPLLLRHTVTEVRGSKRVEQVVAMQVDEKRRIIPGTEKIFDCDTLLLSIGLIPENELSHAAGVVIDPKTRGAVVYDNMETSVPGIFACGNVLHVHDLVDFVSEESESAGLSSARYVLKSPDPGPVWDIENGDGVSFVIPQKARPVTMGNRLAISLRVRRILENGILAVSDGTKDIARFRRKNLDPACTEQLIVPSKLLEKVEGNKLTVSLRSADNE